jgi:putative flavoprotein involved in K+ transport
MAATGADGGRDLDLQSLTRLGVRLTGRLRAVDGTRVRFADDLAETVAAGDAAATRMRAGVDAFVELAGLDLPEDPPAPDPEPWPPVGFETLDLRAAGIGTVVWGTGFSRSYGWLHVPVTDELGDVVQRRGVTPVPGLYFVGLRVMHRRDSHFIDGVGHDALYVAGHVADRARSSRAA